MEFHCAMSVVWGTPLGEQLLKHVTCALIGLLLGCVLNKDVISLGLTELTHTCTQYMKCLQRKVHQVFVFFPRLNKPYGKGYGPLTSEDLGSKLC